MKSRFYATRASAWSLAVVAAGLLAAVPPASADVVVFDNGAPNQHGGNAMGDFLQAEDFTLANPTQIDSVTFWDLELSGADYKGSLYWAIQLDAGGTPGAIVATGTTSSVTRTATGLMDTSGTYSEVKDVFDIAASLSGGVKYWLTLHDGALADNNFADFYWEWSADNGNGEEFDLVQNTVWDSNLADHAFQLAGPAPVPEPGSILLLVTVLGGLGVCRFRASRKG